MILARESRFKKHFDVGSKRPVKELKSRSIFPKQRAFGAFETGLLYLACHLQPQSQSVAAARGRLGSPATALLLQQSLNPRQSVGGAVTRQLRREPLRRRALDLMVMVMVMMRSIGKTLSLEDDAAATQEHLRSSMSHSGLP